MGPVALIVIPVLMVFLYLFIMFIIDFFTELNYKFHNYTPPPVPMYYTYCPPPSPQYYLQMEMVHTTNNPNNVESPENYDNLRFQKN